MGGKGCTGEMQGVPANSSEGPGRNVGAHITATPMAAPMRVPMAIRAAHTDVQSSAISEEEEKKSALASPAPAWGPTAPHSPGEHPKEEQPPHRTSLWGHTRYPRVGGTPGVPTAMATPDPLLAAGATQGNRNMGCTGVTHGPRNTALGPLTE